MTSLLKRTQTSKRATKKKEQFSKVYLPLKYSELNHVRYLTVLCVAQ